MAMDRPSPILWRFVFFLIEVYLQCFVSFRYQQSDLVIYGYIHMCTYKYIEIYIYIHTHTHTHTFGDFPGSPVVKNLPCNTGDTGLIPGPGIEIPHATGQLSLHAATKT